MAPEGPAPTKGRRRERGGGVAGGEAPSQKTPDAPHTPIANHDCRQRFTPTPQRTPTSTEVSPHLDFPLQKAEGGSAVRLEVDEATEWRSRRRRRRNDEAEET